MQHATMSRGDLPYEDSDVDGSDQTYFFVYDLKWRPVATYRGTDSNPKERFVFHNSGLAGRGSSSYIDAVIMRDRDANAGWTSASDATLEERRYYCQNWRADVVALIESDGDVSEWVRYSAYGEATVYPFVNGDFDADGDVDGDDTIAFSAAWDSNANAADVDRANGVDGDDVIAFAAAWDAGYASTAWTAGGGLPAGAGQLSVTSGNRIGYAGYQFDPAIEQYHVRHRVYSPEMGRWTRRDPLGYVDGMGLMEYVRSAPAPFSDPRGGRATSHSGRPLRSGFAIIVILPDATAPVRDEPWSEDFEFLTPGWAIPEQPGMNCDTWDVNNPAPWTTPQPVPPAFESGRPGIMSLCRGLMYPPGIASWPDCYCWERRRIIDGLGAAAWDSVRGCAGLAKYAERQFSCTPQRNAMRHCVYACCLNRRLAPADATDILNAHECCTLNWDTTRSGFDDLRQDLRGNAMGGWCAPDSTACTTCCSRKVSRSVSCGGSSSG